MPATLTTDLSNRPHADGLSSSNVATESAQAPQQSPRQLPEPAPVPVLVLDACVMMSGLLRPLLLNLALAGAFRPVWSDRIGQEWVRNAARLWPIAPSLLEHEWQLMQLQFPQANMGDVTAYEAGLRHSDRKDWHVVAAGIAAVDRQAPGPVSVMTWNLKDFSRSELRNQQLGLTDPDRLLSLWWPTQTRQLRQSIENTVAELITSGRRQPEPTTTLLRRDRLFRLAAMVERSTHPA